MAGAPRSRRTFLVLALLALLAGAGCGGASAPKAEVKAPGSDQKLPFHQSADQVGTGDAAAPGVPPEPKSPNSLPFGSSSQPQDLPAGTMLTVSLDLALSDVATRAGEPFSAVVMEPVVVQGSTVVEKGATALGRVESTQRSFVTDKGWYVRLVLEQISVNGKEIPLETSTLLAQGSPLKPGRGQPGVIQLPKGRRLTFRLMAPAALDHPSASAISGTR